MNEPEQVIPIEGRKKKAPKAPEKLMGAVEPRIHTPYLKGKSKGDEIVALAEKIGMPLMPYQKLVIEDMMKIDDRDKFKRRTAILAIARQNGKTHLARMRILWGLLNGERIVAMSSNRNMALDTFREVVFTIESNEWLRAHLRGKPRMTNGSERVEFKNGGRYEVVAATKDGSRGKTADFLYIDELREITEEAWKAARPVVRATGGVTWATSNAGDIYSTVLNDMKSLALENPTDAFGWYEYSAEMPNHGWNMKSIWDKKLWAQSNPALGHLIDEDSIAESIATTTKIEATLTETFCVWVDSQQSPWPLGVIEDTSDSDLQIMPGRPSVFAFDVAPHRKTAALVIGSLLEDGRIAVGMVQTWRSDVGIDNVKVASDIYNWYKKYRPTAVCYDKYATADIAVKLQMSNVPLREISGQAFYQACSETLDSFINNRLVHSGQPELVAHLNNCAMKQNDTGWRLIRRKSAGDISGAISLCMVIHEFSKPQSKPTIIAI